MPDLIADDFTAISERIATLAQEERIAVLGAALRRALEPHREPVHPASLRHWLRVYRGWRAAP